MEPYASVQQVYAGAMVFSRLAAMVMTMPVVGEQAVPARIRLAFALVLTLTLTPVVMPVLPALPVELGDMALQVVREVFIGIMIGAVMRIFMSALAVAGEVISIQSTLSFAQTSAPGIIDSSTTLGTFLGLIGLILIFSTNLHHLFLGAMVNSYNIFPFGVSASINDSGQLAIRTLSDAFRMGIQLSAPVLVLALVFNVALGLAARIMPQFQVFFVASPLMVLLSLAILSLSLGMIGMVWVNGYGGLLKSFSGVGGG
ncbi:flagellar biosynthetic protein FliR [Phenylobacterium sp.]|uniref:flagellar biosynthetic protein FliR n=1 Tax=Phenylobacterium sp. TaxID=1871053 RepID=UPI0025F6B4BC|nr:flagellar biosynthetic protein FliR [Phenylobacterium sp.]MCA6310309.1 flagellar type III secretion system protein FliR [Phenylobacterium sp.]MCA6324662.1 flagellar type III secretion system protein FliR [Phenylobacterium sp.]MCA6336626.1 flagellar type III secretion system protein FliR [Phenylobacterium sp.]MCA6340640.1 flagellar type III secretion system protein FliR [Phenylobacterium sp.]MCA6341798.1 flagellar type III secretion system protein FliR [Phenylobacterium sp.]